MENTRKLWEVWEFKKSGAERMSPDIPEKLSPRFSPGAGYVTAEQYVRDAHKRLIRDDKSAKGTFFHIDFLSREIFIVVDCGDSSVHLQVRKCRERVYPFYNWERKEHEKFFENHAAVHAMD